MFERLMARLHRDTPPKEPLATPDARMALGILLVRLAMVDRAYLFEEVEEIDRVLARAFDLRPLEAAKMRARCEDTARRLPKDVDLAQIVHDSVDYAHRLDAVAALWSVALSDHMTDDREAEMIHLIETRLGVSRADSDAARRAAEAKR
ncbi:hypothetical protein DU478_18050 [Thalassococcus profundi]|uniref:Co-chaperone DjlA N-terminal domain-containing protein n=1 Tax=Thalassococcus profundi TaxID=2282382 RepID=A0A369THZ2_9RHOB|nr:TerB family tellurite resistance protein [Thalassococcus profundi]RDD64850.1 hypothetical protein DU478_18050 [Thalassococcus profundi]